ncbi:hypothetical protein CapIbe_004025 [Capra ibex]
MSSEVCSDPSVSLLFQPMYSLLQKKVHSGWKSVERAGELTVSGHIIPHCSLSSSLRPTRQIFLCIKEGNRKLSPLSSKHHN